MNDNKKAKLFFDASRSIRSLADVFEAIAKIYSAGCTVEVDEKVNAEEEAKKLAAEKKVTLEDVRYVLAQKSQAGMTAEVRELIRKYGCTRLSDIYPAQYKSLLKDAEALVNE